MGHLCVAVAAAARGDAGEAEVGVVGQAVGDAGGRHIGRVVDVDAYKGNNYYSESPKLRDR